MFGCSTITRCPASSGAGSRLQSRWILPKLELHSKESIPQNWSKDETSWLMERATRSAPLWGAASSFWNEGPLNKSHCSLYLHWHGHLCVNITWIWPHALVLDGKQSRGALWKQLFTHSLADWIPFTSCDPSVGQGSFASLGFLEQPHTDSHFSISVPDTFANPSTSLSPSLFLSQELCYKIKEVGLDGVAKPWKASVKLYIFL